MASQPTSNFDFQNYYSGQLTADITSSSLTISLDTVPTPTEGILVIEPDSTTNREIIYYTGKTVSTITLPSDGRGWDGTTAVSHTNGSTVIMAPTAYMLRMLKSGSLFDTTKTGWTTLGSTPAYSATNGNRSFNLSTLSDLSPTLSKGMRLKFDRVTAAPTQCTSLNGTTQYYSKTAPAGMTFTTAWAVSAWVKLSSYNGTVQTIASRYNGTSGWDFDINSSGQVRLIGYNAGAANTRTVISYQSIPLNKWVHVAAQNDMTVGSTSPTTSYIMIDGVDVPASVVAGGTSPVSIVQAGNLEIGSQNGGTLPFGGKIAQVAIYSAKVTEATILASMHQGLAGTETSLISAYSFNNSILDLNRTQANDLTANGSAVATNADSPFAQGSTTGLTEYGIITAISSNSITLQCPEGSCVPATGTMTNFYYSTVKAPYGMPVQRGKWCVDLLLLSQTNTSGTSASTVYNPGGLNLQVPIGEWKLQADLVPGVSPSATLPDIIAGVSSANNSFTNLRLAARLRNIASGSSDDIFSLTKTDNVSTAAMTAYYLNLYSVTGFTGMYFYGNTGLFTSTQLVAELATL